MAFTSLSPLSIKSINISNSSSKSPYYLPSQSKPFLIVCSQKEHQSLDCSTSWLKVDAPKSNNWRAIVSTAFAAAAVVNFGFGLPAIADLNKFEAEQRDEFGIGSTAQFGSADLKKTVNVNENFR